MLGAVRPCAPNYDGIAAHVNDDNRDIMYVGPDRTLSLSSLILDVDNDDYYLHGRDDCPDIADNPLLVKR